MEIAAGDAGNEGFLFLGIGKLEIGSELSRDRKSLVGGVLRRGGFPLPWFIAPDSKRAAIGRQGRAFRAEEALGHIPPAFRELRRAESDVDAVGVVKNRVVVSVAVAVARRAAEAAAGGGCFQRMRLKDPVADVDDVDVLLDDDVAGEGAVIEPIAKAALGRRG